LEIVDNGIGMTKN